MEDRLKMAAEIQTIPMLRELYRAAVRANHEAQIIAARAQRSAAEAQIAAAAFNEALSEAYRDLRIPPGHGIDLWGSGEVKRADLCKMTEP